MRGSLLTMLRQVREDLFEKEGAEEIFSHMARLVVATLIMAAGVHAVRDAIWEGVPGIVSIKLTGYAVVALGLSLALLNLFDGLYKLSKKKRSAVLQVFVIVAYVFISLRVAQLLFMFRSP